MVQMIRISLEYQGQQVDYQVPNQVTFERLQALLYAALNGEAQRQRWQLVLKDQSFRLNAKDQLIRKPVADGDVFIIKELKGSVNDDF
jgi:uncharacterized ubiquitin-like protein YukD